MANLPDEALDAFITTRLSLAGVDLDQLPEVADPATGVPTREAAMESLRTFLAGPLVDGVRTGGTVEAINRWQPRFTGGDVTTAQAAAAQQAAAPLEYPSVATAWAPGWEEAL
ncbi:hypothetical protein [Kineococcus sp. SYSU DK018]|uniref:hypothetical protein n=1 Tax=Kineococcus sp. SYSU DK018 TaxID=3383139 RepID=UPI003D7E7BA2